MQTGTAIGPYLLGPQIGRGGMASVFRAVHRQDGTPVALKVLHPGIASNDDRVREFAFEVRTAAGLDHPRITAIYDHGVTTGQETQGTDTPAGLPWLAMELVEGGTLLRERGRLPWPALRQVLLDVLEALAYAHARGLVHRDIKPGNVLLDAQTRRLKLTDFGLVLSTQDLAVSGGPPNTVSGTPAYMAPEQIRGEAHAFGPWTDLYAVGVMAWGLACGANPFQDAAPALFRQHLYDPLPPFRPVQPLPAALAEWLAALVAIDPAHRFQRAADAAHALRTLAEEPLCVPAQTAAPAPAALAAADDETRTLAPEDLASLSEAWLEPLEDAPPAASSSREAPSPLCTLRAPFPPDWREDRRPRVHLHGAGLGLFSLRTASGIAGREALQDPLWRTLGAVLETRRRRLVLLEGAAGSGKTTLVRWLGQRADALGQARWLSLENQPAGAPGDGIAGLLARLFRIGGRDRAGATAAVQARLATLGAFEAEDAAGLVALAQPALAAAEDPGPAVHFGTETERWALLTRLVRALVATRPLVLGVLGLHRDPASLGFVAHLLAALPDAPLLVVGTVTPEEAPPGTPVADRLEALVAPAHAERVALGPLGPSGMVSLIQDLLGLDIALATDLEQRCGGTPQFAVQLVSDWVERGLLVPSPTGFRLRDGADTAVPSGLLALWEQRLDRVLDSHPDAARWALEVGAVLGAEVDTSEWEAVLRTAGVDTAPGLLADLQRRRLVASATADLQRWSFAHGLLREAVLARATQGGRRQRWAQAAVDTLPPHRTTLARRAHLLVEAGRGEEALAPLAEAILDEARNDEFGRADQLARLRSRLLEGQPVDPDGRHALDTDVCRHFLQRHNARRAAIVRDGPALLARAEALGAWSHVAMLELDLSIGLPDWEDGQVHAARSLAVARAHRLPGLGTLLNKLSYHGVLHQRYATAADHARAAVHEAERSGDLLQVGRAYLNLAQVSGAEGRHAQCQFFLDEARDRYAHLGSRSGLAEVCLVQANLSQELGDLSTAERAYREAEVRYRACGSPNHRYAAINLAILRCRDHRFGEARAQLESLDADLGPDGAPRLKAWVRLCLTTCLAHEGAWAALETELPALRALLARRSFHDFGAITLGALCTELCLDAGQETAARLAWALTHDQQRAMHQLDGHPELAARVAALGAG